MGFSSANPHKCRVATFFEKFNPLIKTSLPVRRVPYKRLNLSGPFAAVSFWNTAVSNLFSHFLGGRSDAACRVVILLHASHLWGPYGFSNDAASLSSHSPFPLMPTWAQMMVYAACVASPSPQTPDCRGGVFATRRFPRPPPRHTHTMPTPPRAHQCPTPRSL